METSIDHLPEDKQKRRKKNGSPVQPTRSKRLGYTPCDARK